MAGYLNFQTGQVLTAAQVNGFLMEQATMTFADDAARDAALASVLREGLLTYNLDTNRLEVYDGTDWVEPAPEPPAGIGSNVVQTVKTDVLTQSVARASIGAAAISASITPTSATSKVLVIAQVSVSSGSSVHAHLFRGDATPYRGDADGVRQRVSTSSAVTSGQNIAAGVPIVFLDSPSADTSVTYSVRFSHTSTSTASIFLNRSSSDTNQDFEPRAASSLTLIEVAP